MWFNAIPHVSETRAYWQPFALTDKIVAVQSDLVAHAPEHRTYIVRRVYLKYTGSRPVKHKIRQTGSMWCNRAAKTFLEPYFRLPTQDRLRFVISGQCTFGSSCGNGMKDMPLSGKLIELQLADELPPRNIGLAVRRDIKLSLAAEHFVRMLLTQSE
jgi:hypothetical protein